MSSFAADKLFRRRGNLKSGREDASRKELSPGAVKTDRGSYRFRVWAPFCSRVELKLLSACGDILSVMDKDHEGYFCTEVMGVLPGTRYAYILDGGKMRPDPASRFQPEGVHGPSCVPDPDEYKWKDRDWQGLALRNMIFYEMHIGTFTPEGTFEAAIKKIPYLKRLGITCLEIMPVAQFPGTRNWGYDGVGLYAVQNSYGGPIGLKKLMDACHHQGLAVCLDVVYNHLGPEGNYLHDFGPYFTEKYHTPWGAAVNYDDQYSDHVRRFVIDNALYWIRDYHMDALRLDAIHGIFDLSAKHILQEVCESVQSLSKELERQVHVIAESDLNDSRIIRPQRQGGYDLSGQWSDDFHHALHTLLTGEQAGYYEDFGRVEHIAKAIRDGFVYDGEFSLHRKRRHGNSVKDLPAEKLVVCTQNHDQVGNRAFGERLSTLVGFDKEKIAAALLLLSPHTPLIFMGQEYGERAPFFYFIDHADAGLIDAVREGRKKEFATFGWKNIPDPKAEKTFLDSRLTWDLKERSSRRYLQRLFRDLIYLRKTRILGKRIQNVWYDEQNQWLAFEYKGAKSAGLGVIVSFLEQEQRIPSPFGRKQFCEILHTASRRYGGGSKKKAEKDGKMIWLPACSAAVLEIIRMAEH